MCGEAKADSYLLEYQEKRLHGSQRSGGKMTEEGVEKVSKSGYLSSSC